MKTLLLLLGLVSFSSLGEILSASAMKQIGEVSLRPRTLPGTVLRMLRNRTLLLAICCLALSFFSFLSLLSYADLSYVLPLTAVSYATNTIGAKLWLKEEVSRARWLGTLLVAVGVAIISLPEFTAADLRQSASRGFQFLSSLPAPVGALTAPNISWRIWLLLALRSALLLCVLAGICYYSFVLVAGWLWAQDRKRQRALGTAFTPPVSVLIPVRGADEHSYENFASICRNDYPDLQLLFGVRDASDPATTVIRQLQRDFPACRIELVISEHETGWNAKVSNLQNMYPHVAHDYLCIVDSDIRVGPDYLRRVMAPLQQSHVGMVTCLYRGAQANSFAALLEHISISSTFAPEVVAARTLQGIRFAFGSTIVTRRELLAQTGGFQAVADYLADDYLLGARVAATGHEIVLSDYIVEHISGPDTIADMLNHDLRWGRTKRIVRPQGYAGLVVTYGTATALPFLLAMEPVPLAWLLFGLTLTLRMLVAWAVGVRALQDHTLAQHFYLVPLRDLISFGIWVASFFGDRIHWRGRDFRLLPDGRIRPLT